MPDTISALDAVMRVPNLGLCSIAGNLTGCTVRIADLSFHNRGIRRFVENLVNEYQPDIIGLSAMSFQFDSACIVSRICRKIKPDAKIVLGGYHASLMYEEIGSSFEAELFDFLVRGEGETIFQNLVKELATIKNNFSTIPGLSFRQNSKFHHNPAASLVELNQLKLPDRECRIIDKAQFLGIPFDCVETSRGCTMSCHFCSITRMYGRSIRSFPLERVIEELKGLKEKGIKGVFFVDDNITLDVPRLKNLCEFIISEKLNDMSYVIQASVPGIASDPQLAKFLKRAGFKWVFLGIENSISKNLESMGKAGVLHNTTLAVSLLQEQGIGVFGGFIIGHPQDTREDIRLNYRFALDLGVDHPAMQCLTPYPKTQTREELQARSLIENPDDFSLYNGFTCNVRTEHLSNKQINHAIFWNGLRLYFHPKYLAKSRFWKYKPSLWPALIMNNFRFLAGAMRGRIFTSRHSW
jgi:anaerobic magnesium-protoporphyrin IX monomethyl ester cyclase